MRKSIIFIVIILPFLAVSQDLEIKAVVYIAQDGTNDCASDYSIQDVDNTMVDLQARLDNTNVGININYCIVEFCNLNYYNSPLSFTSNQFNELQPNVLHIYFKKSTSIPSQAPIGQGRILITNNLAYTLTHEFGHAFGLLHGYHSLTWNNNIDSISNIETYTSSRCYGDDFGNGVTDMYPPPHTDNSDNSQDPLIFEDPNLCFKCTGDCTSTSGSVTYNSSDCTLTLNPNATIMCNNNETDYTDSLIHNSIIENYMNQYECCAKSFTQGQIDLMNSIAGPFEIDPDEIDPDIIFLNNAVISGSQTWDTNKYISGTLIIKGLLNIKNTNIRFAPGASIWVQGGAYLNIEDSNLFLYNGPLCIGDKNATNWKGIFLGNYVEDNGHTIQTPNGGDPILEIENAQISFAEYGIYSTRNSNSFIEINTLNLLNCNSPKFYDLNGINTFDALYIKDAIVEIENSSINLNGMVCRNTQLKIKNSEHFNILKSQGKLGSSFLNSIITSDNSDLLIRGASFSNGSISTVNGGKLEINSSLFHDSNLQNHILTNGIISLIIEKSKFGEVNENAIVSDASTYNLFNHNNFSTGSAGIQHIYNQNILNSNFSIQCNYFKDNNEALIANFDTYIGNQGNAFSAAGNIFNHNVNSNNFQNFGPKINYYHLEEASHIPNTFAPNGLSLKKVDDNYCDYSLVPNLDEKGNEEECEVEVVFACYTENNSFCDGSGSHRLQELINLYGEEYVYNSGCFLIVLIFNPCEDYDCDTDDIYNPCYIIKCENTDSNDEGNTESILPKESKELFFTHELSNVNDFKIFPNPNRNNFSLLMKNYNYDSVYSLEIISVTDGYSLYFNIEDSRTEITSELPDGIYFTLIKENGELIFTDKLIINK